MGLYLEHGLSSSFVIREGAIKLDGCCSWESIPLEFALVCNYGDDLISQKAWSVIHDQKVYDTWKSHTYEIMDWYLVPIEFVDKYIIQSIGNGDISKFLKHPRLLSVLEKNC